MAKSGRKSGTSSRMNSRDYSDADGDEHLDLSSEIYFATKSKRRQNSTKLEKKLRLADELRSPRTPGSTRTPRTAAGRVLRGCAAVLKFVSSCFWSLSTYRSPKVIVGLFVALVVVLQMHAELSLDSARLRQENASSSSPSFKQGHGQSADFIPPVTQQDGAQNPSFVLNSSPSQELQQQYQQQQQTLPQEILKHQPEQKGVEDELSRRPSMSSADVPTENRGDAQTQNDEETDPGADVFKAKLASQALKYQKPPSEEEIAKLGEGIVPLNADLSTPSVHTDNSLRVAELLGGVIAAHKFLKVVDVSCRLLLPIMTEIHAGILERLPLYEYVCVDVSSRAVQGYWNRYKKNKDDIGDGMAFLRKDLSQPDIKDFPRGNVLIAYDYFQRMDSPGIIEAFRNIKRLGFKYLIMTTNPGRKNPMGPLKWKYARMDYAKEPYNLANPILTFTNLTAKEECQTCPKVMHMYLVTPRLLRHMIPMTEEEEAQDRLSGSGIQKVMDLQSH